VTERMTSLADGGGYRYRHGAEEGTTGRLPDGEVSVSVR
jgi:hypothetical protein